MKKPVLCLTLLLIFTFIVHGADLKTLCEDDDWIAYEDEKCVKLFQSFETHHGAEGVCNQQGAILVTIKAAAEQKFLTNYVFNTSDGNNIWIGAERRVDSSTEFDWNDGTPVQRFTNWAIGRPSDDVRRSCVHMKSPLSRSLSEMEWVDVGCNNGHWFICEKLQVWPIQRFQQVILNTRRELQYSVESFTTLIEDMKNNFTKLIGDMRSDLTTQLNAQGSQLNSQSSQLNAHSTQLNAHGTQLNTHGTQVQVLQANPVPIGFIYVQLPNQPEPRSIWGTVVWTEVTSQYAGLFFRAQGGNSAAFGNTQAESSPRLNFVNRLINPTGLVGGASIIANGEFSSPIQIGSSNANWGLVFRVSQAEVRPRNQAMRIWRRTS